MSKHRPITRRGTTLADGRAHAADHKRYGRRNFLRTLGLAGAGSVALSTLPGTGLYGFPLAQALLDGGSNRKLVLIRLKGGNDGLNTIVPVFDYDTYRMARPGLAIPRNRLIGLNDRFAIPDDMSSLQGLWDGGSMRVLNGVGYANSSLSHFTGADIWDSGNNNEDENGDGWLARYYTNINSDYLTDVPNCPPAIKIGGPASVLFNDQNRVDISANFASPERLEEVSQSGRLYDSTNPPDTCYYGDQVAFLRTVANAAYRYSGVISTAYNNATTQATYSGELGEQLRLVARLIKGGLDTQLYLVTLDGFDTHVGQAGPHAALLRQLSESVSAFYADLGAGGVAGDVLSMTYSEFGRRISQNGAGGTDHGRAMPVMFFGPAVNGQGIHGDDPDLSPPTAEDNLLHSTDFRSVYGTVLQDWFCADAGAVADVLGQSYPRVEGLGFSCSPTSTRPGRVSSAPTLPHRVDNLGSGRYRLVAELPSAAEVALEVFTVDGRRVLSLPAERATGGEYAREFGLGGRLPAGVLVYRLRVGGAGYGGKFLVR